MTDERRCRVWCQGGLCALPYHHEGIHRNAMHLKLEAAEQLAVELGAQRDRLQQETQRLRRILLIDGAGATACLTGEPITSNPYQQPGEDWHLWRGGWERIEYKALATEMAHYIDATKEIVSMVTRESDAKPPSSEIGQANRLLARWDAMREGRAYLIDNRIGSNFGKPIPEVPTAHD